MYKYRKFFRISTYILLVIILLHLSSLYFLSSQGHTGKITPFHGGLVEHGYYFMEDFKVYLNNSFKSVTEKDFIAYEDSEQSFQTSGTFWHEMYKTTFVFVFLLFLVILSFYYGWPHLQSKWFTPVVRQVFYWLTISGMIVFFLLVSYESVLQITTWNQEEEKAKIVDVEREKVYGRWRVDKFYVTFEHQMNDDLIITRQRVTYPTYELFKARDTVPVQYEKKRPYVARVQLTSREEMLHYIGFRYGYILFIYIIIYSTILVKLRSEETAV